MTRVGRECPVADPGAVYKGEGDKREEMELPFECPAFGVRMLNPDGCKKRRKKIMESKYGILDGSFVLSDECRGCKGPTVLKDEG